MINSGEAALAVIGITNVVKGDVPKIGLGKQKEINTLGEKINGLAKDLTKGTLPEPSLARVHNYRATLDRLSKGMSPQEIQELTNKFPDDQSDMAGQFLIAVQAAFAHLKDVFPTSDYNTFAGPTQLVPDTERVWIFFLMLQVINDPLVVFPLIAAGAILPPQVTAVREFFPSIADAIDDSIYASVASAKASKFSYRLPPNAETGVATWLARRSTEFQPTKPAKIAPTVKRPPNGKLSKTLESPGQQAANPAT